MIESHEGVTNIHMDPQYDYILIACPAGMGMLHSYLTTCSFFQDQIMAPIYDPLLFI